MDPSSYIPSEPEVRTPDTTDLTATQATSPSASASAVTSPFSNHEPTSLSAERYIAVLNSAMVRLEHPESFVDRLFYKQYTVRSWDCIACSQYKDGVTIHRRKPHTMNEINTLRESHNLSGYLAFARNRGYKLATSLVPTCPLYHVPVLYRESSGSGQEQKPDFGTRILTIVDRLNLEFGPAEYSDWEVEGFSHNLAQGLSILARHGRNKWPPSSRRAAYSSLVTKPVEISVRGILGDDVQIAERRLFEALLQSGFGSA